MYAKAYPDVAQVYGNDKEALWNHYEYKAEHEHTFDGMKQIEGTLTHGPVCTTCGYIDKEKAAPHEFTSENNVCAECGYKSENQKNRIAP